MVEDVSVLKEAIKYREDGVPYLVKVPYHLRPENQERLRLYSRKNKRQYRRRILDLYGGVCVRCGFANELALQLDHINSNPRDYKYRSGTPLYRLILAGKVDFKDFQLLCANCNWIKKLTTEKEFGTKLKTVITEEQRIVWEERYKYTLPIVSESTEDFVDRILS